MAQNLESKWQQLRCFLERYLEENTNYRAGDIYNAYINDSTSNTLSRKDFEMFLRDQVNKDNGMLKRVSHGVYTIRTDPNDRGVVFSRPKSENTNISLDEILDDIAQLESKIDSVFQRLNGISDIDFPAQMELKRLKALLTNNIYASLTHVSATMAWCEDNIPEPAQDEPESIKMV